MIQENTPESKEKALDGRPRRGEPGHGKSPDNGTKKPHEVACSEGCGPTAAGEARKQSHCPSSEAKGPLIRNPTRHAGAGESPLASSHKSSKAYVLKKKKEIEEREDTGSGERQRASLEDGQCVGFAGIRS